MSLMAIGFMGGASASSDRVADFYRGRTVYVISAGGAGGAHGLYGQVIASHIKRHIPGNPNVVIQYMLGAGGNISMNYLYNVAAKDGTYIGVPLQDLIFNARIGVQEVKYDPKKVRYLGGADTTRTVVSVMRASKIATLRDAADREVLIGTSGRSGQSYIIPVVLNALLNTKFRPIMGYKDISEIHLAMERGEVQGTAASWPTIANTKQDWVKNDLVLNLVTIGLDRDPELPSVPAITELATAPEDKDLVELLSASAQHGRAWIAMGDIPADRLSALRKAFADTMADPAFREETAKRNMTINPVSWQDQESAQRKIIDTSESAVARLKKILEL
ncbi:MAG: hypothetical protein ACK4MV_09730 [Beijerinckiaceae bacterium]